MIKSNSNIIINSAESAWAHFADNNSSVVIRTGDNGSFDYRKKICFIGNFFVSSSYTSSGWGFEMTSETDGFMLSLPKCGLSEWVIKTDRLSHTTGSVLVLDSQLITSGRFSMGTQNNTVFVPNLMLVEELSMCLGFPALQRISFKNHQNFNREANALLSHLISSILLGATGTAPLLTAPLAVKNLQQALITAMLHVLPNNYSRFLLDDSTVIPPTPKLIKSAISFIMQNSECPITLSDIAKHSSVSVRALQLGFKKYRGMTPLEYIRGIRLENVNLALSDPLNLMTIKELALKAGFTNYYLFSKYFYQRYGVSPDKIRERAKLQSPVLGNKT
ncbi:helix-turn-helix transcriptional regulator [Pseudomonas syringae]|nr:helix-turn-helix transcriptional regulator [Pseudomonas syringae]